MNLKIMGHPLNWLIVPLVLLLGAYFILHMHMGVKQVSAKVKGQKPSQPMNMNTDGYGGTYPSAEQGN